MSLLAAAIERPEPRRDRFGRYLIPHPDTGKEQAWTRATTWAKSLSDTHGITKWELRMAAVGLAKRDDLLAQVATVTDPDDPDAKRLLGSIVEDAKEAAGASKRRNLGTALHSFTERLDRGEDHGAPEAHRADLDAYQAAVADAGLIIDPDHIERIVVVPELGVAGTFDRLVTLPDGRLVVADLKTGRDVAMGMGEIAVQLALYANASHVWDAATGRHEPMPAVDKTTALVLHLPVGEARCTIYEVDIAAGWDMAQVCGTVRDWRRRRDLSKPYTAEVPAAPAAPAPSATDATDATAWVVERIRTVAANADAKAALSRRWPEGCPTRPPFTDEQLVQLDAVLVHLEAAAGIEPGFPPSGSIFAPRAPEPAAPFTEEPEPAPPALWEVDDTPGDIDAQAATDITTRFATLPEDRKGLAALWAKDAKTARKPWAVGRDDLNPRRLAIYAAVLACLAQLWDGDGADDCDLLTRAALSVALGRDLEASWRTGAVIGALSLDQARRLDELAGAFATDGTTATELGAKALQLAG